MWAAFWNRLETEFSKTRGEGGCYERGNRGGMLGGFGYRITRVKLPEMTTHDFEKDSSGCVHTRRFKPKRNPRDGRED